MGMPIAKIGFMSIFAILFVLFINQMPSFMGTYANYLMMALIIIFALMIVWGGE